MKIRLLAAAVAFASALTFSACSGQAEGYTSAQGSVGATRDDALVFAADTDTDQLFVFDTTSEKLVAAVKVGQSPEKVLVGKDDTVFVTNRMGRSVSVIRRGEWSEAARLSVGVEPVAMALTGDGKTLYVVSSTSLESADFGILSAIDTGTLATRWELPVGHEPRGIALLDGNRALISLFKDGDVALVDLAGVKVLKGGTDLFQRLNSLTLQKGSPTQEDQRGEPFPSGGFGAPSTARARGIGALAVSPDGRQVYAAARLSSDGVLASTPTSLQCDSADCGTGFPQDTSGGGSGYGGGSCGATAVSSPALLTFDQSASPIVDDVINCFPQDTDRPPMVLSSGNPQLPIQGPSAAVVDPTGSFVFIVNHDSNNVAIVNTSTRSAQQSQQNTFDSASPQKGGGFGFSGSGTVKSVVSVGAGPTGIALARDGKRAWVYNSFDHSISRIESVDGIQRTVSTVVLGSDVLAADVVVGRKLFFTTLDQRMNNLGTGISCGTCHLDGREDGHVWNFTEGPRQTPTLAGRMLSKTAPFHWGGEFASITDFMTHTITNRMGGKGVTPEMEAQLSAFINAIPAADNPHKLTERTEAQLRGAQVFTKAQCNGCHAGEVLTDNKFWDVGTLVRTGPVLDDVAVRLKDGLNTPSLFGLARTAPYLHDGSAATLKDRLLQGKAGDLHGRTAAMTDAEMNDLVAYLQTL